MTPKQNIDAQFVIIEDIAKNGINEEWLEELYQLGVQSWEIKSYNPTYA